MESFLTKTHFEKFRDVIINNFGVDYYKIIGEQEILKKHKFVGDNVLLETFKKITGYVNEDDAMMRSILSSTYHFYKDPKIYEFEKSLTEMLLKTSLKKLDVDFVRSPYDTIYVTIPKSENLTIPNEQTGLHRVEAVYITAIRSEELSDVTVLEYKVPENYKLMIRYLFVGESKKDSPLGDYDDALYYNTMILGEGDIFEQMNLDLERKESAKGYIDLLDKKRLNKYHSFIVNLLLYITSSQARIEIFKTKHLDYKGKKPKKIKRAEKQNNKLSKLSEFYKVGCKTLSTNESGETLIDGKKITTQYKVSPHWHLYWTGKGRKTPKLKWIVEYTKGKDFAEAITNKTTKVK